MRVYIKFISTVYLKSLIFVFLIMTSLVFILNILSELDFFKDENVSISFTLFLSLLNSPIQIFELFPFTLLIAIQLFFIKFFENKEIDILKYSGLKNSSILYILSGLSILTGILIISIFYHLSSNLKNIYLEIKSGYTSDGKYLAVITKNGLWIKDKIDKKIIITNASAIDENSGRISPISLLVIRSFAKPTLLLIAGVPDIIASASISGPASAMEGLMNTSDAV